MTKQIPMVDYLVLGERPHLVAVVCDVCGARFFGRRNACASCGGVGGFSRVEVPVEGVVRSFTIVHHAAPGVVVPFVAAVVDCGETAVKGNVVNTPADPGHVSLGMKVRLATFSLGVKGGVEAVGFGFEPA